MGCVGLAVSIVDDELYLIQDLAQDIGGKAKF